MFLYCLESVLVLSGMIPFMRPVQIGLAGDFVLINHVRIFLPCGQDTKERDTYHPRLNARLF